MKANLSTVPVFSSSNPSLVFGFILKWWSTDEPQISTIASHAGKQTTKDKKMNKVLADSLFFSKNCSKRQMMNSLWTESSLRNSTAISQSNLCNCLYSHNSCFTSSSVLGAKYTLFNASRVRISISVT